MMKWNKCCLTLLAGILSLSVHSQIERKVIRVTPLDWHMMDFSRDSVYGAGIDRAYEFLEANGYKPKRKTVVAILDSGGDILHEDLKNVLWTNKGEIPDNGIDDDKNGYVDDIHGWNFFGRLNGTQIELGQMEGNREFVSYYEKYLNADTTKFSKKEMHEYHYFTRKVCPYSGLYKRYLSIFEIPDYFVYADDFTKILVEKYPDTVVNNKMLYQIGVPKEPQRNKAYQYFMSKIKDKNTNEWKAILAGSENWQREDKEAFFQQCQKAKEYLETLCKEAGNDIHCFKQETGYGNNNLIAKSALHGTHVAGIVGADRYNSIGIKGIADVEIMFVRMIGLISDELDKDVATGIRYAVDNGANVINMSFAKYVSPHAEEVIKAFDYARKKGVILVKAAGNEALNVDVANIYPQKRLNMKKTANLVNVGSLDYKGNPSSFSDYGKIEVDIFAPGGDVYSTIPDNKYQACSGTSMASPVIAGVVALLWNYFPELTAAEVIDVLCKSGTSRRCERVELPRPLDTRKKKEVQLIDFGELCVTGSVVNAYEAVKMAAKKVNGK